MIEAPSFFGLIERRAEATPDAIFLLNDEWDRGLGFKHFRDAALNIAAGLAGVYGIRPGTRVSWMMPTGVEALVLAAALSRLGAVQIPILPIYRQRELAFVLRQTGAEHIFFASSFRGHDLAPIVEEASHGLSLERVEVPGVLPYGDPSELSPLPETAPGTQWIYTTSGTTADPKCVRHSDQTLMKASAGLVRVLELGADDRFSMVFPVAHVGGAVWTMASLMAGSGMILIEAFDPKTSPEVLRKHGVTHAGAATVFHQAYLEAQRGRTDRLFPALRSCPGGGAPKPPQLHHDLKAALGGVGIVSGYGLTECPIATMNTIRDPDDKLAGTEGRPNPPTAQIRIVDGEVRVRAPQLFLGYVDPALDAAAFDEDGFFRTGDLGRLDADGFLTITGRLKDVIIRKGENISAKEIEDLLYTHPKVREVAVVGLPDPELGERCCAIVVARTEPLSFDEMRSFLAAQGIMRQKIPEQLEHLPELPRNANGKIQKNELRARYLGSGR
jgi:acyl-CoA synthetase (AMP-forming)/AMP-acid ligase II